MAPFDKDPKTSDTPPALSPGVSGVFGPADPTFKGQGDDAGSSAGEFTKLFGKPPKPAPLEGIGTDSLPAGVTPATPAIASEPALTSAPARPGSFTMIFGAGPVTAKPDPVSPEPLSESTDGFAKTSVLAVPAKGVARLTPPEAEARPADKFDSLFPAPAASAESSEPPLPKAFVVETAAPAPSAAAPPHKPSEFTMMFSEPARSPAAEDMPKIFEEPTSPEAPATPSPVFAKAEPQSTPGSFTQLFGTPAQRGEQTPPPSPVAADASPGVRSASPEEFASIFNFPLRDSSATSEPPPKSAPGEFTAMFNSAPVSPSAPPSAPTAKDPGAFTKLFNAPAPSPAAQAPSAPPPSSFDKLFSPAPAKGREESFTGIFGAGAAAANGDAKSGTIPPESRSYPASNLEPPPRSEAKPPMATWPPPAPASTPAASSSSGATQIFTRPGGSPAPAPPPPPTGPSAFTQVISGGMVREATQRAAPQVAPPSPPQFVPPGYPPMPAAVPPAMPAAPTMPQPAGFQPTFGQPPAINPPGMWPVPPQPQMPSMQYPQMPQPLPQPQVPRPSAPPKTNWLPLIIGVNIFVLIVVILIVIFALRK